MSASSASSVFQRLLFAVAVAVCRRAAERVPWDYDQTRPARRCPAVCRDIGRGFEHRRRPVRPSAVSHRRSDHRPDSRRFQGEDADLSRAHEGVPRSDRRARQAWPRDQRNRAHESAGAGRCRLARQALRDRRPVGSVALHSHNRERQLRDRRHADHRWIAGARRMGAVAGCHHGATDQECRGDRAGEVEPGRVGVHAVRNREFDPAGVLAQSVCTRSRYGRVERRHSGRCGRQLRRHRTRHRHRQFHSWAIRASGPRGNPLHDGTHVTCRCDPAQRRRRRCWPNDTHRGRCRGGPRRGGGH